MLGEVCVTDVGKGKGRKGGTESPRGAASALAWRVQSDNPRRPTTVITNGRPERTTSGPTEAAAAAAAAEGRGRGDEAKGEAKTAM